MSNDTIANRTRDLPACSAVLRPTAPQCTPLLTPDGQCTTKNIVPMGDTPSSNIYQWSAVVHVVMILRVTSNFRTFLAK